MSRRSFYDKRMQIFQCATTQLLLMIIILIIEWKDSQFYIKIVHPKKLFLTFVFVESLNFWVFCKKKRKLNT